MGIAQKNKFFCVHLMLSNIYLAQTLQGIRIGANMLL